MATKGVVIPLFNLPYYSYSIALEGASYILQFVYNERTQLYSMNILTADNVPVLMGVGVVPSYPITIDYTLTGLSGWFWMQEKATSPSEAYKQYPDRIDQFYDFFYSYVTED